MVYKALLVVFAVFFVIAIFVDTDRVPAPSRTAEQVEQDRYRSAIELCKQWTRANAKLGVGEELEGYRISGRQDPGRYHVGFDWRAQGSGLLMASDCLVLRDRESYVMLKAEAGPR